MIEANAPVDISPDMIKKYKNDAEDKLVGYQLGTSTYDLSDLIRDIDADEPNTMQPIETETYHAIRDGIAVFKAVAKTVGDKIGVNKKLISGQSVMELEKDKEYVGMREFANTFAAYAASKYVSHRIRKGIQQFAPEAKDESKPDLSFMQLNPGNYEKAVLDEMLVPVYSSIIKHAKTDRTFFKSVNEFPLYAAKVFEKNAELALAKKDLHPEYLKHVNGYQFRIGKDEITLDGFEDKTQDTVPIITQKPTFSPIDPNKIVGNQMAKRKIARYVERLFIYDSIAQINPILNLGGLAWTVLFDGLPGTGKSSLFRMAMTLGQEYSDTLGVKFNIFSVDQSIKKSYYGETGAALLGILGVTKDANAVNIGIFDDLDLLTSSRDTAQGADNDINNIIMQYLDGVFTRRLGNVINFTASNKPTGLDSAVRNRMNDRLLIDGPVTAEDFADMFYSESAELVKRGKITIVPGYTPFATQDMRGADGKWSLQKDVAAYMAEEFSKSQFKNATIHEFGKFMAELKRKMPSVTGRASKAILEAIKERTADFDLPREWLQTRGAFLEKPLEEKKNMIEELYVKVDNDVLFQEAQRFYDSEVRYADTEARDAVTRNYNARLWDIQSNIKLLKDMVAKGSESALVELAAWTQVESEIRAQAVETIQKALKEKAEHDAKKKK